MGKTDSLPQEAEYIHYCAGINDSSQPEELLVFYESLIASDYLSICSDPDKAYLLIAIIWKYLGKLGFKNSDSTHLMNFINRNGFYAFKQALGIFGRYGSEYKKFYPDFAIPPERFNEILAEYLPRIKESIAYCKENFTDGNICDLLSGIRENASHIISSISPE